MTCILVDVEAFYCLQLSLLRCSLFSYLKYPIPIDWDLLAQIISLLEKHEIVYICVYWVRRSLSEGTTCMSLVYGLYYGPLTHLQYAYLRKGWPSRRRRGALVCPNCWFHSFLLSQMKRRQIAFVFKSCFIYLIRTLAGFCTLRGLYTNGKLNFFPIFFFCQSWHTGVGWS